jgi:hypothetical protein
MTMRTTHFLSKFAYAQLDHLGLTDEHLGHGFDDASQKNLHSCLVYACAKSKVPLSLNLLDYFTRIMVILHNKASFDS